MFQLLIVDDEPIALEGVRTCVNWNTLHISSVYTAQSASQARAIFVSHTIDILICDIEMPGEDGFSLSAWVRDHSPSTIIIMLTCHAEFDYARRALDLGSLNYLLKPVSSSELAKEIQRATEKLIQERNITEFSNIGRRMYKYQGLVRDQFWNDVFDGAAGSSNETIARFARQHGFSDITDDTQYLPVLIQLQDCERFLSPEDSPVYQFGMVNLAAELITGDVEHGIIVRRTDDILLAILNSQNPACSQIQDNCVQFIQSCNSYFQQNVCCYIGDVFCLSQAPERISFLQNAAHNNVVYKNRVFMPHQTLESTVLETPEMATWTTMILNNEAQAVICKAKEYLFRLRSQNCLNADSFAMFRHDYLQLIYVYCNEKGIQAHLLYHTESARTLLSQNPRSIEEMYRWIEDVTHTAVDYAASLDSSANVIDIIKKYITLHLAEEITRADLSNLVFLSPDYINRILKKETGQSITEYIMSLRLARACELLENTDMKVSAIAASVGYTSFSYFSKIFKRLHGVTPEEYRDQKSVL